MSINLGPRTQLASTDDYVAAAYGLIAVFPINRFNYCIEKLKQVG